MGRFTFSDSWRIRLVVALAIYAAFLAVALSVHSAQPAGPQGALFRIPFCVKENNALLYRCHSSAIYEFSERLMPHVVIYEDDKPLTRSSPDEIRTLGGRFAFSKETGLVLSPNDNATMMNKNGHDYWVVLR